MTDIFDRAQELEQLQRDTAIADARSHAPHGHSEEFCEECGERIPDARREAIPGCTRCVDCQQDLELAHAMWDGRR